MSESIILGLLCLLPVAAGEIRLPPPAMVFERGSDASKAGGAVLSALRPPAAMVRYDIGDPTDEEQLYLELMNRSRRNPTAEGPRLAGLTEKPIVDSYTFFSVDLERMRTELAAFPPAQPLAFEPRLIAAARGHSLWMQTVGLQQHNQTNLQTGMLLNTPAQRVDVAGYPWQLLGESIFAYAESEEHGHAGFVVDWGPGSGGVQDPPGHRINNFRPDYREVGIGVLNGPGAGETGPQIVTVDFSARRNPPPIVTGVIFYDLNGNGFYDLGEGVGDVTVNVSGATAFAVSAASGGYAVPSANGARNVTFSWSGGTLSSVPAVVQGGTNVQVDLLMDYPAPVLTGPSQPSIHQPNGYSFTAVPGAVGYWWRTLSSRAPLPLNAEGGLSRVLLDAPGTPYPLVPRGNGQAYHLTHYESDADQVLEFDGWVRPKTTGQVSFAQRLGYAGRIQVASLEVLPEEAKEWSVLWSKSGDASSGARNFSIETASLSRFAGQLLRVRFRYAIRLTAEPEPLYRQPDPSAGLQLDDVRFSDAEEVTPGAPQSLAVGVPLVVTPDQLQPFELSVRPARARGLWPWGPALAVIPKVGPPPSPVISGAVLGPNGNLSVDFSVAGGLGSVPTLLRSPILGGVFQPVAATLKTNFPGNYSFQYPPEAKTGFLRVSVP